MKIKLILIIALFIWAQMPMSAQEKSLTMDSYSIIKRNGGPFGFRFVEYNKGKNNTGGIHHNIVCEGWGFSPSKIPFIINSDNSQTYEELISNAINDIVSYCILNANDKKCKGEYIVKVLVPKLDDTTNQQCQTFKIKWRMESDNCEDEHNILTESNNNDK